MENRSYGDEAMTFDEIGAILGIKAGTARALFTSGMVKLRSRCRTPLFQELLSESKEMRR
jgi:hypothetical protein